MSTASGLEAALTAFEDPAAKARDLLRLHRAWAHTHEVPAGARGVVARSWLRQTPEGDKISTPISDHALLARRERSRLLASVVPVLKDRLLPLAHEAGNEFVISDDEGYPLWMFGPSPIRRRSDGLGFVEGARWREGDVGTNSLGTAMEERRPVQIFGPEHAREDQHAWVCTSAPILDRRARTPLGVVTLSGAFRTAHPHTLMLVTMAVREAVDTLAGQHERDLRRVARASESYAGSGRFVVVDRHGWVARAEGYGVGERVWVPGSLREGTVWVPEIGQVRAEAITGGWVLHEAVSDRCHRRGRPPPEPARPRHLRRLDRRDRAQRAPCRDRRPAGAASRRARHRRPHGAARRRDDARDDPGRDVAPAQAPRRPRRQPALPPHHARDGPARRDLSTRHTPSGSACNVLQPCPATPPAPSVTPTTPPRGQRSWRWVSS